MCVEVRYSGQSRLPAPPPMTLGTKVDPNLRSRGLGPISFSFYPIHVRDCKQFPSRPRLANPPIRPRREMNLGQSYPEQGSRAACRYPLAIPPLLCAFCNSPMIGSMLARCKRSSRSAKSSLIERRRISRCWKSSLVSCGIQQRNHNSL